METAETLFRKGKAFHDKNDFKNAFPFFLESARLGDARAQAFLSNYYGNGKGVEQNDAEQFRWALASAEQGHPAGQAFTGISYLLGLGVESDDDLAYSWLKRSADQQFAMGKYYLGLCFYYGFGIEADSAEAFRLFHEAAALGDINARDIVENGQFRHPLELIEKIRKINPASR